MAQVNENPLPKRRRLHLRDYDYSSAGGYFITVCARDKRPLFGAIIDGQMSLNPTGAIVRAAWLELPDRFCFLHLDEFVVMPNHFHGVVLLLPVGSGLAPTASKTDAASRVPTLHDVMCAFKSLSSIRANRLLNRQGESLWQRRYHEHVIRNEHDMTSIREYIVNNPLRWELDEYNPYRKQ